MHRFCFTLFVVKLQARKAGLVFLFRQKFEDDMSYWTSLGRARNEYYGGYYQHHYDEDSPIGPRNPHAFRHGAGVNYDDY